MAGNQLRSAFRPHLLKVFLSNRYCYASILHKQSPSDGGHYVASASTLQRELREALEASAASRSDVRAAALVGKALAERARQAGVAEVHWDNHGGLRYQGKVKAMIDAMRAAGLHVK